MTEKNRNLSLPHMHNSSTRQSTFLLIYTITFASTKMCFMFRPMVLISLSDGCQIVLVHNEIAGCAAFLQD